MIRKAFRAVAFIEALIFDKSRINSAIPRPVFFTHENGLDWIINNFDSRGKKILEIGARELTRKSVLRARLKHAEYVGFDICEGKNVDVVGDAHRLSEYFDLNHFDLVYSHAVFQHLAMPWIVSEEISKVLRLNGVVCIETTFSYRTHERPWNFFHISDAGLKCLFNSRLGFECLDTGLDVPMVGRMSMAGPKYLRFKEVNELYALSYFVGRKYVETEYPFDWHRVTIDDFMPNTNYPFRPDL